MRVAGKIDSEIVISYHGRFGSVAAAVVFNKSMIVISKFLVMHLITGDVKLNVDYCFRFNISQDEIMNRKRFIQMSREQCSRARDQLNNPKFGDAGPSVKSSLFSSL